MALIFNGEDNQDNLGRVVVLEQADAVSGSLLQVDGWAGFQEFKAIFTRLQLAEQTNHQFLHTLGNRIYMYVFGDRIGQLGLTGLAFYDACGSGDNRIGLSHVRNYFRQMRLSQRQNPLRVTIDPTTVFECYLHSIQADTVNTADRMFQFNLTLALLPDESEAEPGEVLPAVGGLPNEVFA